MKLQTASKLAIYAVLELARDPERQISAAEIAEKYDVSIHHLAKVLHTLGRAGHVRAVRGASGGYVFSGNPKRTTLSDIVTLFERIDNGGSSRSNDPKQTPVENALSKVLGEIDDITEATLSSITLATMLRYAA
ncbi:MAG: Rrf2 family transcriptional regulator [Fimbriimonadaceae bacterium]|nr:Rrf2 family transcriptional regulator [Alphaproteobacteria bacterium]